MLLVADEVPVLVDEPLRRLVDRDADTLSASVRMTCGEALLQLLAGREELVPGGQLPGDVRGLVGQSGLLEDGGLVVVRDRTAVDREAHHRTVRGDAPDPLPGQVLILQFLGTERAQVHELVGVGQIRGHVLAP